MMFNMAILSHRRAHVHGVALPSPTLHIITRPNFPRGLDRAVNFLPYPSSPPLHPPPEPLPGEPAPRVPPPKRCEGLRLPECLIGKDVRFSVVRLISTSKA